MLDRERLLTQDEPAERPVPICPGKGACPIFSTADLILSFFHLERDGASFENLMLAMQIAKKFQAARTCPFAIKGEGKRESFRNTVCKLRCEGTYSTTAVSTGVGFSKTRVHQLEKSGMTKLKRRLVRTFNGSLEDVLRGVPIDASIHQLADLA